MAFIYFGFELTWWRVLQKRVVRNKLDIYILITVSYHKVGRRKQTVLLNNIIKKQLVERAKVGHGSL